MRYVVTGGAGFIGSHIAETLLREGHDVVVVDDLFSGKRENLDLVRERVGDAGGDLVFHEASILDAAVVDDAVAGAEAVFHQAAIASVPRSIADPAPTLRVNVEGTAAILEACRRRGVGRFVMASSSSVYGDTPTLPKHEEMPASPLSPYALSKLAGEHLCSMYLRYHGIDTVALRYFNIFGPRQDPESDYAAVIPKFITRMLAGEPPVIYGDGHQSRDFTFIDNAVAANLAAAGVAARSLEVGAGAGSAQVGGSERDAIGPRPEAFGTAMNVGVGTRASLLELVEALNRILGTDLEPRFEPARTGDVRDSLASVDRARELIGYRPVVGFDDGLRRTVESFLPGAPVS